MRGRQSPPRYFLYANGMPEAGQKEAPSTLSSPIFTTIFPHSPLIILVLVNGAGVRWREINTNQGESIHILTQLVFWAQNKCHCAAREEDSRIAWSQYGRLIEFGERCCVYSGWDSCLIWSKQEGGLLFLFRKHLAWAIESEHPFHLGPLCNQGWKYKTTRLGLEPPWRTHRETWCSSPSFLLASTAVGMR